MYRLTDIYLKYLFDEYIELFENFKNSLLKNDSVNILLNVNTLYDKLLSITKEKLLELAQRQYDYIMQRNYDYSGINKEWLEELFENFDPTVKYVFINEVDRKRSRMYESVMSSNIPNEEIDKALTLWCRMIAQEAVSVTDEATLKAYRDSGVFELSWISEDDEKRCRHCKELHGKIFRIDEVPPKPHWNCRCYCVPVQKG